MCELSVYARKAKDASFIMATLSTEQKNNALKVIMNKLKNSSKEIFDANAIDVKNAEEANLPTPLLHRLKFNEDKLATVCEGIEGMIGLCDPVGKIQLHTSLDDGLELYKISSPIGVIGVIFESRPDALVQIASLCLKSGNAVFLKGGSEAAATNRVLADVIYFAGLEAGLPEGWLHLLTTRADVSEMLKLNECIDLIIPRGSNSFVKYIMDNTSISVLGHSDGVCHLYIDDQCDEDMAIKLAIDSKTQSVSVCNAVETILVSSKLKDSFLARLVKALQDAGVKIYGDDEVSKLFDLEKCEEWHHEYLDMKVAIKLVSSVDEAISHINMFGSKHTDSICTSSETRANKFTIGVDSGNVYVNCSTRFSDGFRYGFGAEVGVSTSKFHARGPVGLEGLVTYKYKLVGNGALVGDYCSHKKSFNFVKHDIKD